eukprot:SM000050S17057  [mRNA]  locus=s50:630048:632019:+ [translate_table: standard]
MARDGLLAKLRRSGKAVRDAGRAVQAVFERHNVVLTIGASLASAGAAWAVARKELAGYTARQLHQRKLEERLRSIEHTVATAHNVEEEHVKELTRYARVGAGVSYPACAATAGTVAIVSYALGWRQGRAFVLRRLQRQGQRATPARASSQRMIGQFKAGGHLAEHHEPNLDEEATCKCRSGGRVKWGGGCAELLLAAAESTSGEGELLRSVPELGNGLGQAEAHYDEHVDAGDDERRLQEERGEADGRAAHQRPRLGGRRSPVGGWHDDLAQDVAQAPALAHDPLHEESQRTAPGFKLRK